MKIFLTAFCLVVSVASFAQIGQHALPERKDNTIFIYAYDSDSLAYQKVQAALFAGGWFIDQQNEKAFVFKTSNRVIPAAFGGNAYLTIQKTGTNPAVISITGYYVSNPLLGGNVFSDQVSYIGAEGALNMKAFALMDAVAKAYPEGKVYYNRK